MLATHSGKCDEKSGAEHSAEKLLRLGTNRNSSVNEDANSNKHGMPETSRIEKKQQLPSQHGTMKDDAPPSQVNETDGLQWFSSLACERCSSPESIGEDALEELRESNSYCYRHLLTKLQLKDISALADNSISFCDVKRSTPKESAAKKPCDRIVTDSSDEQPLEKRQKPSCDAKDSSVRNASSKAHGLLVPYSDSSDSSLSPSCDNASDSDQSVPRKMRSKKEDCKSVGKSQKVQKAVVCAPEQQHEKPKVRRKSVSARRTSARFTQSSSGSAKRRYTEAIKSTSGSDTDSDSDIGSRCSRVSKTLNRSADKSIGKKNVMQATEQQKGKSPAKSGSIGGTRAVVGNSKTNTSSGSVKNKSACLDIWSSDYDDVVSIASTATRCTSMSGHSSRPRAPYTKEEREAIVWYIIDHKCYKLIKGIALWQKMEKDKVCDRTWQSMKEHFIKKILPQIETFHLDPHITKRFVSVRKN